MSRRASQLRVIQLNHGIPIPFPTSSVSVFYNMHGLKRWELMTTCDKCPNLRDVSCLMPSPTCSAANYFSSTFKCVFLSYFSRCHLNLNCETDCNYHLIAENVIVSQLNSFSFEEVILFYRIGTKA